MNNTSTHQRHGGLLYGLAAYAVWGVLPLYFSLVTPFVKPLELLAHRLLWGLLFLSLALTATVRWGTALATLRDRRTRWLLLVSALLVATNWFVFLFGVSSGRVVETSLGYFLTPLVSIVLGLFVFRERLRPAAKVGLVLSVAGIAYLVAALGTLPWMALTVAFSFGLYGMVRKIARVDGLVGLFVETLILAPAAAVYLLVQASSGVGAVMLGNLWVIALLVFSGTLTAVPMICYGEATRRLKLSTLGFLQYLLPTLQLLQAVTLLGEPFRPEQQVCFALIWTALALVAVDSVLSQHRPPSDPGVEPRPTPKEVRADWKARLPGCVQPFLTWLMAYPYPGQKPLVQNRPWWVAVLIPAAILTSGLALSIAIVNCGGYFWFAIPVSWLLVVNGARTLQVHICHQGVHDNLSGDATWDRVVVEAISTLLAVQDHDGYKNDHDGIHHPSLASNDDPDRQFTIEVMKIEPGADKSYNKRRFLWALLSPKTHALFLAGRFKANFITCPPYRRLMSIIWLVTGAAVMMASQKWAEFFLGWVLPLTALYHMSAMCQFVTEHFWARRRQPGQTAKEHYLALLVNRHLGDPLPTPGLKGLDWWSRWMVWWVRLFLYHTPARLGILVADLPVHGSHHLWPLDKRWTNATYSYHELAQQTGKSPIEFVGSFGEILDFVMASFTEAPPSFNEDDGSPMTLTQAVKVTSGA